jgi:hypothetical protein
MRIHFDMGAPQWFTLYAWGFLEDVYRLRTVPVSGHSRLWHIARLLGACATNLRNACEAEFKGELSKVPDQELMWFVTATRHLNAHGGPGGAMMKINRNDWRVDAKTGSGELESNSSITIDLNLSEDFRSEQDRQWAIQFFTKYEAKLYPALHAATRKVAEWTGTRLDADFETIGFEDYGVVSSKIPVRSFSDRDKLVRAHQGHGEFVIPVHELGEVSWSIDGRWVE